MIRVLAVDDEPLSADEHRASVERLPGFRVVGVAHSGREALRVLAGEEVDLVLLDFFLPDMNGLDVCRALRARGQVVDVVAVTSARDVDVVRSAVASGVVQYLLKPFTFALFRDKLERYADYRRDVDVSGGEAAQADVDRALGRLRGSSEETALPKGLSAATFDAVLQAVRQEQAPVSASWVADALGISRVTARRYLEHLVDVGSASRALRYGATGRPGHLYTWGRRTP